MNVEKLVLVLQEHEDKTVHTHYTQSIKQHIQVIVPAGATFKHTITSTGKYEIALEYEIILNGKGASAQLEGRLYLQESGNQTWIIKQIHQAPETESYVNVKAVLADQSALYYKGTITIEKAACKSIAHQEQKNLVISKGAQVTSIPELQVLTHDVQCGHGSAVSYLDDHILFYLSSRGIHFKKAQQMIIEGFLNLVIEKSE